MLLCFASDASLPQNHRKHNTGFHCVCDRCCFIFVLVEPPRKTRNYRCRETVLLLLLLLSGRQYMKELPMIPQANSTGGPIFVLAPSFLQGPGTACGNDFTRPHLPVFPEGSHGQSSLILSVLHLLLHVSFEVCIHICTFFSLYELPRKVLQNE